MYISKHLFDEAVDVRTRDMSSAQMEALAKTVRKILGSGRLAPISQGWVSDPSDVWPTCVKPSADRWGRIEKRRPTAWWILIEASGRRRGWAKRYDHSTVRTRIPAANGLISSFRRSKAALIFKVPLITRDCDQADF
ncbi:MAG: hypothetical protein ACREQX_01670 [Candidatus Binataceae bacterium]